MHLPIMNSIEQVHKTNKTESRTLLEKGSPVFVYGIIIIVPSWIINMKKVYIIFI